MASEANEPGSEHPARSPRIVRRSRHAYSDSLLASRSLHRRTATLSIRMPRARQAFRFADLRDVLLGSVMARRAARGALVPILLGTALGGSAAAGPLALDEALARARAASPALRVAAAELEAAHGRLRQARLVQANPVLSADLARHTAPAGDEDAKDRGVQLEQEIEVGGQRGLRIAAAEHDVTHAEHLLADRRRTVEGEVRARLETEANRAARRGRIPNPVLRGFYREEQLQEHIVGGGVSVPLPIFNREQGTQAALLAGAHGAAAEEARLRAQIPREVHLALAHRRAAGEAWRRYG